jgi:hypothetical protein
MASMKLLDTYRQILTECDTISNSPPPRPNSDSIDHMLRTATYGLQLFDTTSASVSDARRTSGDSSITEVQIISPPEQPPRRQVHLSPDAQIDCIDKPNYYRMKRLARKGKLAWAAAQRLRQNGVEGPLVSDMFCFIVSCSMTFY